MLRASVFLASLLLAFPVAISDLPMDPASDTMHRARPWYDLEAHLVGSGAALALELDGSTRVDLGLLSLRLSDVGGRDLAQGAFSLPSGVVQHRFPLGVVSAEGPVLVHLEGAPDAAVRMNATWAFDQLPSDGRVPGVQRIHADVAPLDLAAADQTVPVPEHPSFLPGAPDLGSGVNLPASLPVVEDGADLLEGEVVQDLYPTTSTIKGNVRGSYDGSFPSAHPTYAPCSLCFVELWDLDETGVGGISQTGSGADFLGATITERDGDFALEVANWDLLADGVDVFLVLRTDNTDVPVSFPGVTPPVSDVLKTNCSSGICTLDQWTIYDGKGAAVSFVSKAMADGWFRLYDVTSVELPNLPVHLESANGHDAWYARADHEVHLEKHSWWTQSIINHEQAHFLMHHAQGFVWQAASCPNGGVHYLDRRSNLGCAWAEGWAPYFAHVTINSRYTKDEFGTVVNIENAQDIPISIDAGYGDRYEALVMGTLWDLVDSSVDGYDTTDYRFEDTYDVLSNGGSMPDLYHYYTQWQLEGYSKSRFQNAAKQNEIVYA